MTQNHTIRVVYASDIVGEKGDEPDNIPDMYQKKVTFKVVNGTWNSTDSADKVSYVTLTKEEAKALKRILSTINFED